MADFLYVRDEDTGEFLAFQPGGSVFLPVTRATEEDSGEEVFWHEGLPGFTRAITLPMERGPLTSAAPAPRGQPLPGVLSADMTGPSLPPATAPATSMPMAPPMDYGTLRANERQDPVGGAIDFIGRQYEGVKDFIGYNEGPDSIVTPEIEQQAQEYEEGRTTLEATGERLTANWLNIVSGMNMLDATAIAERVDAVATLRDAVQSDPGFDPSLPMDRRRDALAPETQAAIHEFRKNPANADIPVTYFLDPGAADEFLRENTEKLTLRVLTAIEKRGEAAEIPRNVYAEVFQQAAKAGLLAPAARDAFMRDPWGVMGQIGTESALYSAPAIVLGVAFGPAGAFVGGFMPEYGMALNEALEYQGVDTTDPEAIRAAMQDPEQRAAMREFAAKRGIAIATFDAISVGLVRSATRGLPTAVSVPAATAAESVTEGAGEALAQAVTKEGEVDPSEVASEMIGGLVMGTPMAAAQLGRDALTQRGITPPGVPPQAPPADPTSAPPETPPSTPPVAPPAIEPSPRAPSAREDDDAGPPPPTPANRGRVLEDVSLLLGAGVDPDIIEAMNPTERAASADRAREAQAAPARQEDALAIVLRLEEAFRADRDARVGTDPLLPLVDDDVARSIIDDTIEDSIRSVARPDEVTQIIRRLDEIDRRRGLPGATPQEEAALGKTRTKLQIRLDALLRSNQVPATIRRPTEVAAISAPSDVTQAPPPPRDPLALPPGQISVPPRQGQVRDTTEQDSRGAYTPPAGQALPPLELGVDPRTARLPDEVVDARPRQRPRSDRQEQAPIPEIEDHSRGSIIVRGVTEPEIRRIGQEIGVRPIWNTREEGYILPRSRREQVTKLLSAPEARLALPPPDREAVARPESTATEAPEAPEAQRGQPGNSWVIRNRETGEVVLETFDRKAVEAINTKRYEAVPTGEYLGTLNKRVRDDASGSTGQLPAQPAPEAAPEPQIEDFSDRSIVIRNIPETEIRQIGSEIGVQPVWNATAEGWIVAKAREEAVRAAVTSRTPPDRAEGRPTLEDGTVLLDPDDIQVDAKRFQFKSGGNERGVTGTLRVDRWDPSASGLAIVWEDQDGKLFIADGHQRLAAAQDAKRRGDPGVAIRAKVLRAADGVTAEEARASAALKNIAEGGETTTPIDVARAFRAGLDRDTAAKFVPRSRASYRQGLLLADLGDDAWSAVVNEKIRAEYAAEVAREFKDPAEQAAAIRAMISLDPSSVADAQVIIGEIKNAGMVSGTQDTLFGPEAFADTLIPERAKILSSALKQIRAEKNAFKTAINAADVLSAAGNTLNAEANARGATQNEQMSQAVQRLAQMKGPVSDALSQAARSVKSGELTVTQARAQFIRDVQSLGPEQVGLGAGRAGDAEVARPAGQPEQVEVAPQRSGTTDAGRVDITPEGQQAVIPGAEQITDRERAERAMAKAKRGGSAPPPAGGLFDDDARAQTDMFDTPAPAQKAPVAPEMAPTEKTDIQKIADRKEEFIKDLTREAIRVKKLGAVARSKDKRSSAKINLKQISLKYGISSSNQSDLDMLVGFTYLGPMMRRSSEVADGVRDLVETFIRKSSTAGRGPTAPTAPATPAAPDPNDVPTWEQVLRRAEDISGDLDAIYRVTDIMQDISGRKYGNFKDLSDAQRQELMRRVEATAAAPQAAPATRKRNLRDMVKEEHERTAAAIRRINRSGSAEVIESNNALTGSANPAFRDKVIAAIAGKSGQERISAIESAILSMRDANKREYFAGLDKDGALISLDVGTKAHVQPSMTFERAMMNPDYDERAVVSIHNHPNSSAFSPADLSYLFADGSTVIAVGADRVSRYEATISEPPFRTQRSLRSNLDLARSGLVSLIQPKITSGEINIQEADNLHVWALLHAVAMAGIGAISMRIPQSRVPAYDKEWMDDAIARTTNALFGSTWGPRPIVPGGGPRELPIRVEIVKDAARSDGGGPASKGRSRGRKAPKAGRVDGPSDRVDPTTRESREAPSRAPISDEARRNLRERLTKIVGERVALRFDEALQGQTDAPVAGAYRQFNNSAEIIIGASPSPMRTLNHEAIHALYNLGLFTEKEWSTLQRRARQLWIKRHDIAARYPEADQALLEEEAIAEAFADWADGAMQTAPDPIVSAFKKILNLFEAVRNWMEGNGFRTADDVFGRVDRGEMRPAPRRNPEMDTSPLIGPGRLKRRTPPAEVEALVRESRNAPPAPFETYERIQTHKLSRLFAPWNWGELARAKNWEEFKAVMTRTFSWSFGDVERQQAAIERSRGGELEMMQNAAITAKLYVGRAGERLQEMYEKQIRPTTRRMRAHDISQEEVDDYLTALHAEERNKHIADLYELEDPEHRFVKAASDPDVKGGSGMSANEARAIVRRVESDPRAAEFKAIARDIRKMLDDSLKLQVDAGLIAAEDAAAMRAAYRNYVPLRGQIDEELASMGGTGRGFDIRGLETHRATGRYGRSDSPLAYAFSQAANAIIRAEKNRVGQTMLNMVTANPAERLWSVDKTEIKTKVRRRRYLVEDPDTGLPVILVRDQAVKEETRPSPIAENQMSVKVGGKEVRITFENRDLAVAMKNLNPEVMNSVLRGLNKITRVMAALNTSWNVEWFATNLVRDLQTAGIQITDEGRSDITKGMLKNIIPAAKGAFAYASGTMQDSEWAQIAREFAMNGGKVSYIDFKGVEEMKDMLVAEASNATPDKLKRMLAYGPQKLLEGIEIFTTTGENAIRLAAYKAAKDAGMVPERAAAIARDITVDFNRKGTLSPALNAVYMFFNAAVQGSMRLIKSIRRSKVTRRALVGLIGLGFAETLLGAADDEEYAKVPDWVRERNLVIMLNPLGLGEPGEYSKMPMPYGYNVFKVLGTEAGRMLLHGATPGDAAARIGLAALNSFNPIGGQNLITFLLPTAADPFAEIALNENYFGNQIAPTRFDRDDPKPESQRYFESVNPAFKWMSRELNALFGGNEFRSSAWMTDISPEHVEHVFEAFTGGVGRLIGRTMQTYDQATNENEDLDWQRVPFVRNFYGQTFGEIPTLIAYDDVSARMRAQRYEIEESIKAGRPEIAEAAKAADPVATALAPKFQQWDRLLDKLRRQERTIRGSRLPDDKKQEQIDRLRQRATEIRERALDAFARAEAQ